MAEIHELAATMLVDARRSGTPIEGFPDECRPKDTDTALATQTRVLELLGEKVGGWKCSVPSGDRTLLAPLPASTVRRSSPCPIIPKGTVAEVEPEIAFVLQRDITPRTAPYTEDEVRAAIGEVRVVLELMASRYLYPDSVTWFETLADSVKHQGLFVGPVLPETSLEQTNAFHLVIEGPSGVLFDRNVKHPQGHPLKPLYWLVNFLSSKGRKLEVGTVITTGSYAGIIEVPMEVPLQFTYGDLGRFSVRFTSR